METSGRHVQLICGYSLRHAVRGGAGLVFLLVALLFALIVANVVISPVEQIVRQQERAGYEVEPAAVVDQLTQFGRPVIAWALGDGDGRWADYLLIERPALLSAIFLVLLFGVPLLVPLGAFNQTAGDIGSRGIRYLLLRTERPNIFLGRFLATALFTTVVLGFAVATIALYLGFKLRIYGGWEIATWSLYGFVALAVLAVPYVALCSWISGAGESALLSLVVCVLVIGGVLLLAGIGGFYWEPARYLRWLLPWGVQNRLLSPTLLGSALAVAACGAYTACFLYLGNRHFARRDL
jgi:ABC-type transport system involved in multi-copper enzyme maturation permease subunit